MEYRRTYTTIELYNLLNEAINKNMEQHIINQLAFELVCRIYVPFSNKTFDELLIDFGYVDVRDNKKIRND